MFLAPLIRWLANHHNPRVAFGVALALALAAIGIATIGIGIHQPAVTRIGVLLIIASIAVFAIRSRRDHTSQRDRTDE
jgi:hypothetical protein